MVHDNGHLPSPACTERLCINQVEQSFPVELEGEMSDATHRGLQLGLTSKDASAKGKWLLGNENGLGSENEDT